MSLVGVSNFHYSKITTEDTVLAQAVYAAPVKISGTISVEGSAASNSATLFGDNAPIETATCLGDINVTVELADVDIATEADLLGHAVTGGIMESKASDVTPYVGIMFEYLKGNGKKRYVKLLKGQFQEPAESAKTKSDKIEFGTTKLVGKFVARKYDEIWKKKSDEDHPDYVASIGANWYTAVEAGADATPPTITSVPANSATNVAVDANVVLTFSEAMTASSLVIGSSFILQKSDGTQVAGVGAWTVGNTVYTFNPTSNLAAGSNYNIIVTQSVKDIAGVALAAVNVFNFATAA